MATWNSDNIIITKKGEEVLSKVLAGIGKLTISRVVTGAGYVSPSKLYSQTQVSDIRQELNITSYSTTNEGTSLALRVSNKELESSYPLYQIGIYVTHPDFSEEVLYVIAQCDMDNPDIIPLPSETPVSLNYNFYLAHSGTSDVEITVSDAGLVSVGEFESYKQEVTVSLDEKSNTGHTHDDRYYTESETNTLLGGKVGVSDFNSHANNTTVHVTAEERTRWNGKAELTDIPTTLPADGGNADTVDGKHASDFAAASNPVISGTMSLTRSNTTTSNQIFAYQNALRLRCSDTNAADKTYYDIIISPTGLYKEGYSNGTLISKGNLIDGGNADTLDGKHANDFAQMRGDIADCDDAIAFGTYNITPETKNAPTADYYHLVVEPAANGAWIKQTAVLCNADAPLINSFTRNNINGTWSAWSNIADGGNALTATYASYANYAGTLANTASNICLRSLSSGTAAANTTNCPVGAWYGRHD